MGLAESKDFEDENKESHRRQKPTQLETDQVFSPFPRIDLDRVLSISFEFILDYQQAFQMLYNEDPKSKDQSAPARQQLYDLYEKMENYIAKPESEIT